MLIIYRVTLWVAVFFTVTFSPLGEYMFTTHQVFGKLIGLLLIVATLGLLTGCDDAKTQAAAPPPAPLVEVMDVSAQNVPLVGDYLAQTAGSRDVAVHARVTGILEKRTYIEGTPVEKGDLLFEIDAAPYVAALEQAQGDLAQQRTRLKRAELENARVRKLYAANAVSQKDRDDAQAEFDAASAAVQTARARVEQAEINLGYTRVEAPISGVTSKEVRSEGSLASAGGDSLLTTITQVNPLYINFGIPNTEVAEQRELSAAGRLAVAPEGIQVELILPDGTSYEHRGTITFRDQVVDQWTGTVRTRAEVTNPENSVLPGQYVRARVHGLYLKDAIVIPQRAVLETQQGPMVYVVDKSMTANIRPVVIGKSIGNDYVVEKGLVDGESIIVEGIIKARPGQPVRVAPAAQGE